MLEDLLLRPARGSTSSSATVPPRTSASRRRTPARAASSIAVVRDGEVLRFDDERAQMTQAGDRLVCLCARGGKDPHER